MSDSATVLEAFKFIESAAAEFCDEDDEDDSEGRNKTIMDLTTVSLPNTSTHTRNYKNENLRDDK